MLSTTHGKSRNFYFPWVKPKQNRAFTDGFRVCSLFFFLILWLKNQPTDISSIGYKKGGKPKLEGVRKPVFPCRSGLQSGGMLQRCLQCFWTQKSCSLHTHTGTKDLQHLMDAHLPAPAQQAKLTLTISPRGSSLLSPLTTWLRPP